MSSGCTCMNCILSHGNSLITRSIIDAAGQRAGCRHIINVNGKLSVLSLQKPDASAASGLSVNWMPFSYGIPAAGIWTTAADLQ